MSQLLPTVSTDLVPDPAHPPIQMILVPYNPEWTRDFQRETQRLVRAASNADITAEKFTHIGSTSVPGALAKPYIDMNYSGRALIGLEQLGYRFYGRKYKSQYEKNDCRYLYKPCEGESSTCLGYFIHIAIGSYGDLRKQDDFSNLLRSDATLVQQYNEVRRSIVTNHPRICFADYAMLKTAFISKQLGRRVSCRFGFRDDKRHTNAVHDLVYFITRAAAGYVLPANPLPFAPNDVYELSCRGMYNEGFIQLFTPLGLALILAIEPRLSALWDPNANIYDHDYGDDRTPTGTFGQLPLDALASTVSETERIQRIARFAPVIRRLWQLGCTRASFLTFTTWVSPIINAANADGVAFGGFLPVRFDLREARSSRSGKGEWSVDSQEFVGLATSVCPDAAPEVLNIILNAIQSSVGARGFCEPFLGPFFLPDLRNFGSTANAMCHGVHTVFRLLDALHLSSHLDAFIKENVTDDIVGAFSIDELRALGLSIGDAKRFIIAVQQEQAAPHAHVAPGPAVPSQADERTLATSQFRRLHDVAESPELQHVLFSSIHGFIMGMCDRHSVPPAAGKDLFHRLQGESFENPKELLSQVQVAATRIWTSTQKLQGAGVDKALNVEFCSLINRALREDAADVMPHLVVIVRAINALCIVRRESSSLKFPPDDVSHRGGALPPKHRDFFSVGLKYRVPMYLATSFEEDKAYEFWCAAASVTRFFEA
jgi:GrpB-like predicted nucleotidyltransferase (UPF0157 family)